MIRATVGILAGQGKLVPPPLDTYTGAAAAYSLRLLRTAYTGDAIEVRRSSDNTTQDIGFVDGELDTTSLESFCSGTDGFVTTWYDQSGNGNDATQTTAAYQGKIVSSGSTILVNGKAGFLMTSGNTAYIPTTTLIAQSVFSVTKSDTYQVINYIAFQTSGIKGLYNGGSITESSGTGVYDGTNYFRLNNKSLTQRIDYWNHNGTDYECAFNGNSATSVGTTARFESIDKLFGRQQFNLFLNGKGQELIFYSSDQSSNKTGIETNINDFYSIY